MKLKFIIEDYSHDCMASIVGLDDAHEVLNGLGFRVEYSRRGDYLYILHGKRYIGTAKVVKVLGRYVPLIFIFNINYTTYFDNCPSLKHHGGDLRYRYGARTKYNRRIIHHKGRIYGMESFEVTDKDIELWKEIAGQDAPVEQ